MLGDKFVYVAISTILAFSYYILPQKNEHYPTCPTVEIYRPLNYTENKDILDKIINDETFRNSSLYKMQQAIRINTTSFNDDLPLDVGNNLDKFEHFTKFHDFLKDEFKLVYKNLQLNMVNHFGLVYIWEGSNSSLKPLLLMAHQDTSPINLKTLNQWIHEPFSGDYDGKYLYGRGSGDCKNLLIGHLEAIEELIKIGFKPRRTIILSYGFDEEISGFRNENPKFIENIYGPNSMYAIVDEGGVSLMNVGETQLAVVGTAEKGYLDLSISIEKQGGHSSIVDKRTAIGIMGQLIVEIDNNEMPTYFIDKNPTFYQYVCLAENSIDIDTKLKNDILNSQIDQNANENVRNFINKDKYTAYAIKTSQAIDIINGGEKINALPEYVELMINSRVAVEENITIAYNKFVKDTTNIAERYNLGLNVQMAYSDEIIEVIPATEMGKLTIKPITMLEPSPITSIGDKHWEIFAGSIKHLYEELAYPDSKVVVTPGLGTGNTDTKHYWNLSDHIYRYRPGVLPSVNANSHGVNEYIEFDSHLQIIAFTFEYIQSVNALDD